MRKGRVLKRDDPEKNCILYSKDERRRKNLHLSPFNLQLYKKRSEVGDHRSVGIPGNIPNPAVKRVSADGTWRAASWESKKLPTSLFCFKTTKHTGASEAKLLPRIYRAKPAPYGAGISLLPRSGTKPSPFNFQLSHFTLQLSPFTLFRESDPLRGSDSTLQKANLAYSCFQIPVNGL